MRGAVWSNHKYDVTVGRQITKLVRDGTNRFEADGGVVVRNYEATGSRLSFEIDAIGSVKVTTEEFGSGTLDLWIDGRSRASLSLRNGRATFQVPAGKHAIELVHRPA